MAAGPDGDDELEILKVAFGESVRKLEAAHAASESVRSRAGTILAAATAIGGFVGGLAVNRSPQGWEWALAGLGLTAYLVSVGLSLHTLLPQQAAWEAGQNTAKLAGAAGTESLKFVYGRLATRYQQSFDDAEARIRAMSTNVRRAVWLMVAELLLFACLLGVTTTHSPSAPVPATPATTTTVPVVPSSTVPPATARPGP